MPDVVLTASRREERGTPAARRLRATGRIPATLYGHGAVPVSISVDARELRSAIQHQSGGGVLFDLHVEGDEHLVITREIQRHPIRRTIAHVDFQVVRRDEVIPSDVPIHLVGEALSVSRADGTVEHALNAMHVRAKPADIPPVIEVDITELTIGQSIRVSDLPEIPGVIFDVDPDTPIVTGLAPRVLAEVEEGEGEALAAGEEPAASGSESAAPAAESESGEAS